jgi:hypothetical protein
MPTFTFKCGWCGSKDQTADIVHNCEHSFRDHHHNIKVEYRLALLCRRCKKFSSVEVSPAYPVPSHLEQYRLSGSGFTDGIFKTKDDITGAFQSRYSQMPRISSEVSSEIPATVREALLDAEEGRSPRAKCQSYRTALEFALREANVANTPGKTLGGLLTEAQKNVAIPDALIELCDQVKAFGNWGLHWAEIDISDDDAAAAKTIAKAILDYLFVLPAEVIKAKARTDQARKAHQVGAKKGANNP